MKLKKLITGLLLYSLNFSVCTGGFFSVATTMAANIGIESSIEATNMSVANPENFLCQFMSENVLMSFEYTTASYAESVDTGCKQGESCLAGASADLKQRFIAFVTTDDVNSNIIKDEFVIVDGAKKRLVVEQGPHYTQSRLLASILLKRE